jgi:hypothetical protein
VVAFQPLCAPMNATHLVLLGWVVTNALTSLVGFRIQYDYWSVDAYKRIEVATTTALLAFYATAIALRDGDVFAPLPSQAIATDLIDFWDGLNGGTLRAQYAAYRPGGGGGGGGGLAPLAAADGECGWTGWSEVLRTFLALAALTIAAQLSEIFSMNEKLGALMVCASRMASEFWYWLPLVLTISFGTGVALNLLMPHFQSEHGAGAFRPFSHAEFDLSAAGPFWSPFWATFGYYHPGEVSGSTASAFFAPALMWSYLLIVLVLFVNLCAACPPRMPTAHAHRACPPRLPTAPARHPPSHPHPCRHPPLLLHHHLHLHLSSSSFSQAYRHVQRAVSRGHDQCA